jgi:hypothetical protein
MATDQELVATMLDFYERVSTSDVQSFDRLVSADPTTLVIGTAPGEWVTERDRLRFGFEMEGVAIDAGPSPAGHAAGDAGWFVDEPVYRFPGGTAMRTRLSAVLCREGDHWRIRHLHVSVGVPDEQVAELQQAWGTAP